MDHPFMRAKLKVLAVQKHETSESVTLGAVYKNEYDSTGLDENNTFAKFTPTANLSMQITNPDLLGKLEVGQAYYVDFTPAPQ